MRRIILLFLLTFCAVLACAQVTVTMVDYRAAICPGYENIFNVYVKNGTLNTVYQWHVNGVNVGTNSISYRDGNLKAGDQVSCTVHDLVVPYTPVTSNVITMVTGTTEKPALGLAQTIANNCGVQFQALPINGGTAPLYYWTVNGVPAGGNSPILNYGRPGLNDIVKCTIVNTTTCAVTNFFAATITVSGATPGIDAKIYTLPGPYTCAGDMLFFKVVSTPAEPSKLYNWYNNGVYFGGTFHADDLLGLGSIKDGDIITCVITNPDPCLASGPITLTQIIGVENPPKVTITADKYGVCAGTPITFKAKVIPEINPDYVWKINGQIVPDANKPEFTSATIKDADQITCMVTNHGVCKAPVSSASILMNISEIPVITLPKLVNIDLGKSVQLKPVVKGSAQIYTWTPAAGLSDPTIADPIANPVETTTYQLVVTSPNGCTTSASVTVKVNIVVKPPNTFTPNGDGVNDTWKIPELLPYADCLVDIFDRQGQPVFHSIGYGQPWDGTINGKTLPIGTYYYVIDTKRVPTKFAGSVTIVR